jgi:transposase-like protein
VTAPRGSPARSTGLPEQLRQRCLVHRCRNTLAKVSKHDQAEVKADFWAIFDVADEVSPRSLPAAISRLDWTGSAFSI